MAIASQFYNLLPMLSGARFIVNQERISTA
jgi:hypothetical protein